MTLGERVLVKTHRRIRPWFFEQDGGWYVQCRYGARVITADGTNNAVFVKSLADVLGVLDTLLNAAAAGELDTSHYRKWQSANPQSNQALPKLQHMPDATTAKIAALNDRRTADIRGVSCDRHSSCCPAGQV